MLERIIYQKRHNEGAQRLLQSAKFLRETEDLLLHRGGEDVLGVKHRQPELLQAFDQCIKDVCHVPCWRGRLGLVALGRSLMHIAKDLLVRRLWHLAKEGRKALDQV